MTRRRLLLVLDIVALAVVLGCLALWLTAPRYRLDEETIARIGGMTKTEIEAFMGGPSMEENGAVWRDGNRMLSIEFDESGKVIGMDVMEIQDISILEKLRRWLGL